MIDNQLYARFAIPPEFIPYIEKTWEEDHPSIYGRFDLCYKDGQVKLLEFNADTPTSLYEAGIIQWFWLRDFDKAKDQFNSIHEKLIAYWSYLQSYLHPGKLHFACVRESLEDLTNTEYLRDCAIQSGLGTELLFIDDIGWDQTRKIFVDRQDQPIQNIFKLYPWEWMMGEEFGPDILTDRNVSYWIEPAWKMILSNKAILPMLWELYPDSPWLLPAYFEPDRLTDYVRKPILSREGANIEIRKSGQPRPDKPTANTGPKDISISNSSRSPISTATIPCSAAGSSGRNPPVWASANPTTSSPTTSAASSRI